MDPQLFARLFEPDTYQFHAFGLLYVFAALVVAVTAVLIVRWEHGSRPSALIAGFSGLFAAWCLLRGLRLSLDDPQHLIILCRLSYGLVVLSLPVLYWFVCAVLRQDATRVRSIRLNLLLGGLLAPLSTGTPWLLNGEFYRNAWGFEAKFGPLGVVLTLWIAALMLVATRDITRAYRRAVHGSNEHRRVGLLGIATVALFAEATELVTGWGLEVFPLGFLSLPAFTLITAYLAWRYGLVQVTPQLAAREIAELVRGAVFIMDLDGVVQYSNRRAEQLLGLNDKLTGSNASRLGSAFSPDNVCVLAHLHGVETEKAILYRRENDGETRDFALSALPVLNAHGDDTAYTCVIRDTTEQRRQEHERIHQSLHDPLTGLSNRSLFLGQLDEALQRMRQSRRELVVLFIGLNRLRVINEDLGYDAGDRVLQEVARRLRHSVDDLDRVARLGGDEFGVLVENFGGAAKLRGLVQGLDAAIRDPLSIADSVVHISASIGIATSAHEFASGADLLRAAGAAMHSAKESGGSSSFEGTLGGGERTRLESELRLALERSEFQSWFQPVVDLNSGQITGFEALLRWQHPERGLVLPAKFIEFSEEIGLLREIDRRMLEQACAGLAQLQKFSGNRRLTVSLNLCADELGRSGMIEQLRFQLEHHGLHPACLSIEVLETVTLNAAAQSNLHALRELGVGIYIDDFGIGYSALSRLHQMPVTLLKIDREFVRAMTLGRGGEKTISSILALARNLNLAVIAEGIESPDEARKLRDYGCHHVQGFLFSPAVSLDAAQALLANPAPWNAQLAAIRKLPLV